MYAVKQERILRGYLHVLSETNFAREVWLGSEKLRS
jgi:hypothetical protein